MTIGDALSRLTAGLDRDEQIAQAAIGYDHVHTVCDSERCVHDRRHDPDRELLEVALKRLILDEHGPHKTIFGEVRCAACSGNLDLRGDESLWPCASIKALQAIYTAEGANP